MTPPLPQCPAPALGHVTAPPPRGPACCKINKPRLHPGILDPEFHTNADIDEDVHTLPKYENYDNFTMKSVLFTLLLSERQISIVILKEYNYKSIQETTMWNKRESLSLSERQPVLGQRNIRFCFQFDTVTCICLCMYTYVSVYICI